ncbi:MAG: hypothetical protein ACFCBW_17390 [Candidatus Competibacterales bacterium]
MYRPLPWFALIPLISVAPVAPANDFPTLTRVEYVLGCMARHGGQTYDNLYACSCVLDRVAAALSHDDFAEAQVYAQLRSTAGERGSMFRDPPQAKVLRNQLEQATAAAEQQCFIKKGNS